MSSGAARHRSCRGGGSACAEGDALTSIRPHCFCTDALLPLQIPPFHWETVSQAAQPCCMILSVLLTASTRNTPPPQDTAANFFDKVGWHGKVITVSEHSPRAFIYKNFLTPEECDHLIDKVQTASLSSPSI